MEFKHGAHVFSSDGQDAGSVDRVVLDPASQEVVAFVVRKGGLFTENKVIRIDLVRNASEARVTLRVPQAQVEKLPPFEEHYYVPSGDVENRAGVTEKYVEPLYSYPPLGTAWWGFAGNGGIPAVPVEPESVEKVRQNIPEGTIAIKEGARVLSSDGSHVGNVQEVFIDPTTHHATHFIISKGVFFKAQKLIPTNWIKLPSEDEVILSVPTRTVENVPDYAHAP
ncbi:MAG: PRC-barrel domain-containing protein [Chloroflexota bacterium]